MIHRAAPWLLWAAGSAWAAQVYGIGQTAAPRNFQTPQALMDAVDCVRAGDRIVLEAGRTHVGQLPLTLCADAGAGVVEVAATGGGTKSATLDGTRSAADLGLSWQVQPGVAGPLAGKVTVLALGPLQGSVTQVLGATGSLAPAAWPDGASPAGFALARLAEARKQGAGCDAWMCITPASPAWNKLATTLAAEPPASRPAVVLRNSPWSFTRHDIVSVDAASGLLGLAAARGSTGTAEDKDFIQPGTGVALQGGRVALDQAGEWWFDTARRMVFVAVNQADAGTAEASLRVSLATGTGGAQPLVSLQSRGRRATADVTLRVVGLELTGAAGSALTATGIGAVEASGVRIRHAAENGIAVSGIGRLAVTRSQITGTGNNGILAVDVKDVQVQGNQIADAGRIALQPQLTTQFNGIRAAGFTRAEITDNEIKGVGYAGIMLAERGAFEATSDLAASLNVSGNRVSDFCRMLNDCGAIYINGGQRGQKPVPGAGSAVPKVVAANRIDDPRPSMAGLPGADGARSPTGDKSGAWVRMVGAVYLDHGASGYDVRGNTVSGEYTPFGWAIFNGGIENACSRQAVAQCQAGPKAYRCYTDALASCNQAPAKPKK